MNVFLDCGSNLGQGYEKLSKELGITPDWWVYMFEPNEKCVSFLRSKYPDLHIINKAVWTSYGQRRLMIQYCMVNKDWNGGATNIMEDDYIKPKYINESHLKYNGYVGCLDFSKFLRVLFREEDNLIVKFDIEGAEFDVLDKMIADKTILLVDTIYVEWHNKLVYNRKDKSYYIKYFQENHINYKEWF